MPQKGHRTWGTRFDTLPSSPPPSPPPREADLAQDVSATSPEESNIIKKDKMPHDASVFVGSLPTNVEQSELTRLLSEHLSEHAEVKSIKLVKDSKGGVCAFVQCEDANAASSLIHTLHSNAPKPFLGRALRYEPARAFRTLLVSYRTPKDGQGNPLDPPLAMRLWRPRHTKFLALQYNTEAPVAFDEDSLRKVCAYFGPLESFALFKPSDAGRPQEEGAQPYPYPHNAPRLVDMEQGCFEVKWAHRDDCVSALMTLKSVPHFTVTWAHQPTPFAFGGFGHGRFSGNHHHHHQQQYPFHVQHPNSTSAPTQPRDNDSFNTSLPIHSDISFSASSTTTDDWKRIPVYDSSASFRSPAFFDAHSNNSSHVKEWTDVDFPPLGGEAKGDRRTELGVWVDNKKLMTGEREDRPQSPLAVVTNTVHSNTMQCDVDPNNGQEVDVDALDTPALGMSPITPKTSSSQFPTTPTSTDGDLPASFHRFEGSHEKSGSAYFEETKEIDPTTLFVGGLEMNGPDAWNEEKVRTFFGRFGGLESVHVVKPLTGRTAFAFVKFDNTESPARAVDEEHNRVHNGRSMRVQLRDCNPPRGGNWRYGGRGRGRFPHSQQRRFPAQFDHSHERPHPEHSAPPTDEIVISEMAGLSVAEDESVKEPSIPAPAEPVELAVQQPVEQVSLPAVVREDQPQSQSCPVSRRSSPALTCSGEVPLQPAYREWYDHPMSDAVTPPPTHGAHPYPAPYYPPQWAQPYPQQMPYGVPYYPGYPGYPMPGVQPPVQPYSPGGSDASGPPMYGAYMSYPAYPPPRPPNADPVSPRSQAPLQPTGFIQNEVGTLIPVYQPEALDQYMSSNQTAPVSNPTVSPNGAAWQQYPLPPPFPAQAHAMVGMPRPFPPQAVPNAGWVPVPTPQFQAPTPHSAHPAGNRPGNFRGGYQELGPPMQQGPNGRRQPGRRDQLPNNVPKNGVGRGMPNRPRGGSMHQMGQQMHQQHLSRPVVANPMEWSQWS
ncbi:hypothetical protein FB45DRAFT_917647 [Roridomyces roridus]|uniref:RRM domain-containing protein n=1 Tax=Roridomyces roridus TaxID=1738132 RepID=A0AAD7FLU9_9AGAR|nr:hypothetical protein FB45DRAFT_917647 [Roridomyces roridus]